MKHRLSSIFIFSGICLFLIISSLSFAKKEVVVNANNTQLQIKALEEELSGIESERTRIQKELNTAKNNQAHQLVLSKQYGDEVNAIEELIAITEDLMSYYKTQKVELTVQRNELNAEMETELENFDEMVRVSYMYGDVSYLEMILGATDFSDFLSRLDMASYMLEYSGNIVNSLATKEAEIAETEQSLAETITSLAEYDETNKALKVDLEEKKDLADASAKSYGDDAKDAAAALTYYESSKKQIESDIAELVAKAREEDIIYGGGKFIWPVNQNPNARISSGWEWRTNPITKKKEFHNGLDIPAPAGTSIYAAADGIVEKSAWYGGYGECVIVSHGSGIRTLYGHCSVRLVKEGQTVKKGDVIARVGTTGMSTGNHLHFTVYEGTTAVNPWNYLNG